MSSTSYAVADRRRLLPDDATVATHAPSLELMPAFVKAVEHAVSSSAAVSLAVSFCTFTPAMAASARSLAFFFNLASLMSPRIASRVFSACFFFSPVTCPPPPPPPPPPEAPFPFPLGGFFGGELPAGGLVLFLSGFELSSSSDSGISKSTGRRWMLTFPKG